MYIYVQIEFSLPSHFIKNKHIETTHKPWSKYYYDNTISQLTFTCSKLTIETLEKGVKKYSKLTIKTPERRQMTSFWCFYC